MNEIRFVRGDTLFLTIEVVESDGTPYVLKDTDKLVFTVKNSTYSKDIVIQKNIDSTMTLSIEHQDTANLQYGAYVYDVQLTQQPNIVTTVIEPSPFIIKEEVNYDI